MRDNWKEYKLDDLGRHYGGLTNKSKDNFGKGFPFIPYLNIFENSKINPSDLDFVEIFPSESQNKVKYGDLFFTTSSETPHEVGMTSVLLDDLDEAYLNSFCFGFRLNDFNDLLPEYAAYLFRGKEIRKLISDLAQGSTRYNLSKSIFFDKLKFNLPPLPQQRKIAKILTTCDEVIEKTEAAIVKYQALKQGMMLDLFTRGIDVKTGKLRLSYQDAPELYKESELGMIPKDWEVEKSIKLMTLYNGRAYSITEWEDKGTPVIRLQNLTGSGSDYYYSNLQLPENQYCECGDLLYMWSATFGPHIWTGPKAIYHYHIWKIACIESLYSKDFAYIELARFTEKVMQTSQGSTMAHITKGGMEERLISVPPLKEQNLISERLNSLKKKIQTEQSTLAKYQQLKAGLMQDLLTGKVEVSVAEENPKELKRQDEFIK